MDARRMTMKTSKKKQRVDDSQSERAVLLRNYRQFRDCYECHLWGSWRDVDDIFDLHYLFDEDDIQESKQQLIQDFDYYYGQNTHYHNYSHILYYGRDDDDDDDDDDDEEQEEEEEEEVMAEEVAEEEEEEQEVMPVVEAQQQQQQQRNEEFNFAIFNENLELIFGENEDLRLGGGAFGQQEAEEEAEEEEEEEENWDNEEYNVRFDMRLGFITDDYDSGYDEPNSRKEEYPPIEEDRMIIDDNIDEAQERLANMLVQLHLRQDLRPLVNS